MYIVCAGAHKRCTSMDGPSSKIAGNYVPYNFTRLHPCKRPAFSIFPPSMAVMSRDAYMDIGGRTNQEIEPRKSEAMIYFNPFLIFQRL